MSTIVTSLAVAAALAATAVHASAADDVLTDKKTVQLASGIAMRYREAGAPGRPVLILLHGLGDTSRSWSPVMPVLSRRHHVYALDQRGHGDSDAPACCYSLSVLADDVVRFMDAVGIERAAVAGHSMGSFVAQTLAVEHPERVSRIVLLGSSDATPGVDGIRWLWEQARAFGDRVGPEFVDAWQTNPTPVEARFMAQVKAETAAVAPHVWRGVARALLTEDRRALLGEIATPTLILWGEEDPMFPAANQQGLRAAVPGATFRSFPRVGHNLHWEIPQEVAAEMSAFLD